MTSPVIEIVHPRDAVGRRFADALAALARESVATASQSYGDRLAALEQLSNILLSREMQARLSPAPAGLAFLTGFLRRDNLDALVARELSRPEVLERFTSLGGRKSARILPRGLVCHWIAGNVPLLGFFSWAVSAVLGNRNVIRLSSRQEDFFAPLLEALAEASPAGRRIADETLVVHFGRDDTQAHEMMSRAADVRIAWGGEEAVAAIRTLPTKWQCEDIVFGPRISLAVVDPALMNDQQLDRLVTDIVYFDQLACSSPQHLYVRGEPGQEAFEQFVCRFSSAFAKQSLAIPRHKLDYSETYQIQLDRARVLLSGGTLRHDAGTAWTVAIAERPRPEVACTNRFVQIIPFVQFNSIHEHIPSNVQSVVTLLDDPLFDEFTEAAAARGVCRFPRPGEGNHFENPWDGVPLVSRLTRWAVRTDSAPSGKSSNDQAQ